MGLPAHWPETASGLPRDPGAAEAGAGRLILPRGDGSVGTPVAAADQAGFHKLKAAEQLPHSVGSAELDPAEGPCHELLQLDDARVGKVEQVMDIHLS
jgi:hypothetical protein